MVDKTPLELLTSKSQRNLNCLSDPNRSTRRRALKKFVQEFDATSECAPKKKKVRKLHAAFFRQELQHRLLPMLSAPLLTSDAGSDHRAKHKNEEP